MHPPFCYSLYALVCVLATSAAVTPCGSSLCFSGQFNDNMILQRSPYKAAVYGTLAPAGAPVTVTLSGLSGDGSAYNKTFAGMSNPDGTWKVLFEALPAGGNYSVAVSCATCSGAPVPPLQNITFGDVFYCTGQSNAWLPLWFTFARNQSDYDIRAGKYDNVAFLPSQQRDATNNTENWIVPERGQRGNCLDHGRGAGVWCTGKDLVDRPFRPDQGESDLWEVEATCWYTLAFLTDLMRAQGETPPPLGFIATPEGGTMVEQWTDFDTQRQCANMTCLCSTPGCNNAQPLDPGVCWGNGGLYRANVEPYVNTTIRGWLWYQGENNEGTDAGSVLYNTGYACAITKMVAQWRAIWSAVPGTTDPLAPFGFVSIADGTEEGWGLNSANLHWAQTANYGVAPNPALPNSFMAVAHDAGDPWDADSGPGGCGGQGCCVDPYIPLGPKCVGDHRGQWSVNGTPGFMGYLHPRSKDTVARRLAQSAYATIYSPQGPVLATGPVISGCSLSGATLTLTFNQSLLKGESVVVSKPPTGLPMSLVLENTATYVLVNSSLDVAGLAHNHHGRDANAYKGPYSNGNEFGVQGWVAVLPVAAGGNSVTLDLTPLNGLVPTAVRYATGSGGWGSTLPGNSGCGRMCCGPTVDCRYQPCPPDSCPIRASGIGGLPAVPFAAAIVGNKCQCLPPQVCDA